MAKIQNIGVGGYIRNPHGKMGTDSRETNIAVMQVFANNGNSFRCHAVLSSESGRVVLDMTRYLDIPIDTEVKQASI